MTPKQTAASSPTVAMLLADARLPSGGHAHSAGIEPAILSGMPASDVPAFIRGRAHTTSMVEAGTAVVARYGLLEKRAGWLHRVEAEWAARTPSPAQREASRMLGRGYLRLAERTWPDDPAVVACRSLASPPRPIVVGSIAAAAVMEPADLVRLLVYEDAQAAASAVLKLAPMDPVLPVAWVLSTCASVEHLVPALAALTDPADIPAGGSPQSESWAQAHALMTQRLFRA